MRAPEGCSVRTAVEGLALVALLALVGGCSSSGSSGAVNGATSALQTTEPATATVPTESSPSAGASTPTNISTTQPATTAVATARWLVIITGSESDTYDTETPPPAPCYNVTYHHWFNNTIDVATDEPQAFDLNPDEINTGSMKPLFLKESFTIGDNGLVATGLSPNGNGECRNTANTPPWTCSVSRPALLILRDGTLTLTNTPGPPPDDAGCDPALQSSSTPIDANQLRGDKAFTVHANVTTTRSLEVTDGPAPGEVGDVQVTITWDATFEPQL